MHTLTVFLQCFASVFLLVTADDSHSCYQKSRCDIDPELMRRAINLIPDPPPNPNVPPPNLDEYRSPAIFEVSEDAQILVRLTAFSGYESGYNPLMQYLWPFAKSQALWLFEKCAMETTHHSGTRHPLIHLDGQPDIRLGFEIEMTCELDKSEYPDATTYTAAGVGGTHGLGNSVWDVS